MARKKALIERMGDMLMHLTEKFELEDEDPWLYKEIMFLLDELAEDDLHQPDTDWEEFEE